MKVLAVDIGATKLRLGVVDLSNKTPTILHTHELQTKGQQLSAVLDTAANVAKDLLGTRRAPKIGISTAGFLHEDRATICQLHDGRWTETNVTAPFAEHSNRVRVIDDGMASTLAEWKSGAAQKCSDVVVLTVGTKLGSGVILNGRILHIGGYSSPQLGGIVVSREQARIPQIPFIGEECAGDALCASAEKCGYSDVGAMLECIKKDDRAAAALDRMCEYLAMCVANAVNLFAPERVVLTGGVIEKSNNRLIKHVRSRLKEKLLKRPRQFDARTALVEGRFGGNASLIGAALAVRTDPVSRRKTSSR
ncbi:MAG: ROK family protein [Planctomycetes bacterium]|nr:ROK family protein [Planctomycetota bacterium]